MKPAVLIGAILIAVGLIGFAVGHIGFTTREKVIDMGPIQVSADKQHNLPIPDIAAAIALLAGIGLVLTASKRS